MTNEPLVLDFLEWLLEEPRAYGDAMSVWRTSCPRLSIWEDCLDAGLIAVNSSIVLITPRGRSFVAARRPGA